MNLVEQELVEKWSPVLEGVDDTHTRSITAQLLENQAKSIISERVDEDMSAGSTTVGRLGTFQKFAFPLVRRVYPELLANKICGVQPMKGPVSQIFYLGHSRARDGGGAGNENVVYSQYNLTYRGMVASAIDGQSLDADEGDFDLSSLIGEGGGSAIGHKAATGSFSSTVGGQIAAWPSATSILGWSVSAGEQLVDGAIPEINFHIEQQAVVARTKKMRALWSIEAGQDLKAYHNMDLERELTDLLSKELTLEIDRELIEDIRGLAYDPSGIWGGWRKANLTGTNPNNFGATDNMDGTGSFTPASWTYDQGTMPANDGLGANVFAMDLTASSLPGAPQHMGHVYANLLALINLASQDIYRTTWRGPGSWILTSPMVASFLESASKLEGGISTKDGPTNFGNTSIEYKGKFAGRYDLFVDPLYPTDEILIGYKGSGPMDAGFVYCPYIPLQQLPTITDPHTFQPRKGILTRYGKAAIEPTNRYYRIIRFIGPLSNYMWSPFAKVNAVNSDTGLAY